jgi:hypothetical protein
LLYKFVVEEMLMKMPQSIFRTTRKAIEIFGNAVCSGLRCCGVRSTAVIALSLTVAAADAATKPVAVGPVIQINSLAAGDLYGFGGEDPVAMRSDGSFIVAWNEDTGTPLLNHAFVRLFAADGTSLGPESDIATPGNGVSPAAIAVDASGNFAVGWMQRDNTDDTYYNTHVRLFHADGTPKGADICVNPCHGIVSDFNLAMDDSGNFVVTQLGNTGIDVYRFDASGQSKQSAPIEIYQASSDASTATERAWAIATAVDRASGDFAVAWIKGRNSSTQPTARFSTQWLYLNRFKADGSSAGTQATVDSCYNVAIDYTGVLGCALTELGNGNLRPLVQAAYTSRGITLTWGRYSILATNGTRFAQSFAPDTGVAMSAKVKVPRATYVAGSSVLTVDADANLVELFPNTTWTADRIDSLRLKATAASGSSLGSTVTVDPNCASCISLGAFALSINAQDNLVVIWSNNNALYGQRYSMK